MKKRFTKMTKPFLSFALAAAMVMGISGTASLAAEEDTESVEMQTILVKEQVNGTADTSFDYHVYQITEAEKPIETMDDIITSVAGSNLDYTIYDSNTDEELGTETTDEGGTFSLSADEYAEFIVAAETDWYVCQDIPDEYPLTDVSADGDHAFVVDNTNGVVQYEPGGSDNPEPTPEPSVDRDALQEAYDADSTLNESDYTPGSWEPFAEALKKAQDVLNDEDATQEEVNEALKNLQEAKEALEKVPEPAPEPGTPTVSVTVAASGLEQDNTKHYDGYGVTLTAEAEGSEGATLTYQWYLYDEEKEEFQAIEGATESTYALKGNVSDSGLYECVVTATNDGLAATAEAAVTITIEKAEQAISYAKGLIEKAVGDEPFTNELTKTTVDTEGGAAITYASSDETVATVDENGEVTILADGSVTITATVSATDNYEAATAAYVIMITGQEPEPEPEPEAFTVYSGDDNSLTFYWDVAPAEGDVYNDKTVTNVYTDVDSLSLTTFRDIPWYSLRYDITGVVIDPSFAEARPVSLAYWFYGLKEASFSGFENMNTSEVTDMSSMFVGCFSMTSVDVSNWDTANVEDMSAMFCDCVNLTDLDVSGWDTSAVDDLEEMFSHCTSLTSIDVSGWDTSNVAWMGYLFAHCPSLTSVDVSGWDTSNVEQMGLIFRGCGSLESLDVSNWDTSNVTEMTAMFYGCESLTSVDVSGWDTANVIIMDYLFADCQNLTGIDVSGWDTANIVDMAYLFEGCQSLTSIDVSGWDTTNVTGMWAVFAGCASLTNVDVSEWDTSNVTDMEALFESCTGLTGVDVSNWDTSNVRWMNSTFANCESLTSLDLSSWDTNNVTTYTNFATGCPALEWVKIGENTTIFTLTKDDEDAANVDQQIWYDSPENGSIVSEDYLQDVTEPGQYWTYTIKGPEAFAVYSEEDTSLTFYVDYVPAEGDTYNGKTVTTVYKDVDSLRLTSYREVPWRSLATHITDVVFDGSFEEAQPVSLAYWFCYFTNASFRGLTHIDTSNVEEMESMFFDCTSATSLDVSGWDTSNVVDMGVMFSDCTKLKSVDGLSDWDTSSVEDMDSLFNNCYVLESVDVADWDTSNVTQMGYMFYECESLADIDVSNWDTSSVEWMGSMFRNCLSLTALDVSNWDTSCVTDMSNLFYQCVSLSNVDVSGWDTSHVTTMANMFIACPCLTELDVSNWDTSSVWNMSSMFMYCAGLTSLDVSGWDTSNVTGMWALFADCPNLESLDVSDWNTSSLTDMEALFESCTSLTGVDVSSWDTSNVRWMNSTFANCESLTSLDLSSWDTGNVTTYANFATGCPALEWVKIGENTTIFTLTKDDENATNVDQQIWYDSPENGSIVSEDYLQDVTEPGQYWT